MTIWKKALSSVVTAGLLATLLGSAFAGTALAANGTVFPYTASATTGLAADGISHYVLTFGAETRTDVTVLSVTASGGYFLNGTADFVPTTTLTYPRTNILFTDGTDVALTTGSTLWLASSAAGTATVTVSFVSTALGTVTDSLVSYTFTGSTSTVVSTSYSSTAIKGGTSHQASGNVTTTSWARTVVADTNNNPIVAGATVTWTITGPAYFTGGSAIVTQAASEPASGADDITHCGLTVSTVACANSPLIISTGVAGVATISTSVSYLGVSYTLATATLTFTGDISKAVGTVNDSAIDANGPNSNTDIVSGGSGNNNNAISVSVTDSAGNEITSDATTITSWSLSFTPANIFTLGAAVYNSTDKTWDFDATCVTTGTATVTITANNSATAVSAATAALSLTCSEALSSTTVGTFEVTAAATAVAPNGNVAIHVTVKDENGLPAPDGTPVLAVTNGVGNVVSSSLTGTAGTSGGVADFSYLAPANAGSGTVTVLVSHASPSSKAVTIAIGAVLSGGQNASALGLSHSSAFTSATKIQTRNHYVTWKLSFGAAAAGQSAGIWIATKNSAGVWSSFTHLTGRTIDSAGNAYFSWRSSSVKWISIKGLAGTVGTPARQARWR